MSPTAWPQAALLDAFRARDGVELIRDAVRLVLRELIERETVERTDTALTSAPILA